MAVRHDAVVGTPVADGRDQQRQQCADLAGTLAAFRELLDGGFARARRAGRPHRPHAAYDRVAPALWRAGFGQRRRHRSLGAQAARLAAGSMDRDRLRVVARRRRQHATSREGPGPETDALRRHARSGSQERARTVAPAGRCRLLQGRRPFGKRSLPCDGYDLQGGRLATSRGTLGCRTRPHARAARRIVATQKQRDPGAGLFVGRFRAVGNRHARTDAVEIARRTARSRGAWRCSGSIPQLKPRHRHAAFPGRQHRGDRWHGHPGRAPAPHAATAPRCSFSACAPTRPRQFSPPSSDGVASNTSATQSANTRTFCDRCRLCG